MHARRQLLPKILDNFAGNEVIVKSYDLDITRNKIDCMRPGEWLNSEVITWWLEWWRERIGGGSQKVLPYACCVCQYVNRPLFVDFSCAIGLFAIVKARARSRLRT